jgi:hypothetical protein
MQQAARYAPFDPEHAAAWEREAEILSAIGAGRDGGRYTNARNFSPQIVAVALRGLASREIPLYVLFGKGALPA